MIGKHILRYSSLVPVKLEQHALIRSNTGNYIQITSAWGQGFHNVQTMASGSCDLSKKGETQSCDLSKSGEINMLDHAGFHLFLMYLL